MTMTRVSRKSHYIRVYRNVARSRRAYAISKAAQDDRRKDEVFLPSADTAIAAADEITRATHRVLKSMRPTSSIGTRMVVPF